MTQEDIEELKLECAVVMTDQITLSLFTEAPEDIQAHYSQQETISGSYPSCNSWSTCFS